MRKLLLTLLLWALSIVPTHAQSVTLNWIASANCSMCQYNVWRSTTSGGPYQKVNSLPVVGTTYTDTNVVIGVTYYYVASSFFPGGTGAALNVSATNGSVTAVTIRTAGSGYTNVVGQCPNCGLVYQQRQNGPFPPNMTGGGFFPITSGGGTKAYAFCTNGTSTNGTADSIQTCSANGFQVLPTDPIGGSGYASSFVQNIPTDSWDSGIAGRFSNETVATITNSTKPNAPSTSGVWQ